MQRGPSNWELVPIRTKATHRPGDDHSPHTNARTQSSCTGLHDGGLDPPAPSRKAQSTATHILDEWSRLGVGAPSQALAPRHFHGHHLRTLTTAKSS